MTATSEPTTSPARFSDPNLEQALARASEAIGPALGLTRLVGVQHLQEQMAAARDRVRDSHRVQMKALGDEARETGVAGINVQGDTNVEINMAQTPTKESVLRKLLPYALPLALGGGAVAAWPMLAQLLKQPPAPQRLPSVYTVTTEPESDWKLGLTVENKP